MVRELVDSRGCVDWDGMLDMYKATRDNTDEIKSSSSEILKTQAMASLVEIYDATSAKGYTQPRKKNGLEKVLLDRYCHVIRCVEHRQPDPWPVRVCSPSSSNPESSGKPAHAGEPHHCPHTSNCTPRQKNAPIQRNGTSRMSTAATSICLGASIGASLCFLRSTFTPEDSDTTESRTQAPRINRV